jgi:hypothetical protein
LEPRDLATLNDAISHAEGPTGPVYGLERIKGGPHAGIMKTDINPA